MRRATATWLGMAALLLSACGGGAQPPRAAAEPESPAVAACRDEARRSTQVANIGREQNISDPTQMQRIAQRQQEAETRAFRECLRLRGLSRGGGVEAVRRPGLF
jgi:hypothetical protein